MMLLFISNLLLLASASVSHIIHTPQQWLLLLILKRGRGDI